MTHPPPADRPLHGKICMVTGATSGIGEITAQALAAQGARVIVVARSKERGASTVAHIKASTGNHDIELLLADLSIQAQVRALAAELGARHERLDVLVNNAGAVYTTRQESADGIELTLALNHLSYFLLTNLLLPQLKAAPAARVVNVASSAHKITGIDLDDLQGRRSWNGMRAYGQSKLANILFSNELARRLAGSGVTSNALHPGVVHTRFSTNNTGVFDRLASLAFKVVGMSPRKGARTSIYLASAPEVAGVSGKYFVKCRPARPSGIARSEEAARLLWDMSAELTGLS